MAEPWLPDYVAQWYDDFSAGYPYGHLEEWDGHSRPIEKTYLKALMRNPHSTAAEVDAFIHTPGWMKEQERRFHALRVASSVFQKMGFRFRRVAGGPEWDSLRHHWIKNGNLLRKKAGYLLPRELRPYDWCWNIELCAHTVESCFEGFTRWRPADHPNYKVTVTYLPSTPGLQLDDRPLKIAVVPLVEFINDFEVETNNSNPTNPLFRVSLRRTAELARAAQRALERTVAEECDIVIYPELCLTQAIQNALGESLRTLAGKRPWLVVAGSALTPVGDATAAQYNQAVVFERGGNCVLYHHKLNRYFMSVNEEERYGLREVFGRVNRHEEMAVEPYEIQILDTEVGRMAVLICEDLSVVHFFGPLVVKLGLDWLFVPVLDGCQTQNRWTARCGRHYAEKGACVVVATSLSFVKQHLAGLQPIPTRPGVGLAVVPTWSGPEIRILCSTKHDEPAIAVIGEP